jgi:hypothetical protein
MAGAVYTVPLIVSRDNGSLLGEKQVREVDLHTLYVMYDGRNC